MCRAVGCTTGHECVVAICAAGTVQPQLLQWLCMGVLLSRRISSRGGADAQVEGRCVVTMVLDRALSCCRSQRDGVHCGVGCQSDAYCVSAQALLGVLFFGSIMCSGSDGGKALHWSLQGPAACGAWMFALRGIPRVHHPKPQDEHHAVCTLSAIGHTSLHAAGMCLSCRTCCTCTSNRCGPRANSIHSMQHFGGQWWCWCCETRCAVSTLGCLTVGR
jgi:hypothetical protein